MGLIGRSFWRESKESAEPPDRESYSRAALDIIADSFGLGSVWPGDSAESVNAMDAKLSAARQWALTVEDSRAKRAYLGWIEFYQKRADEARQDLTTHAHRKRMDEIYAKDAQLMERVARVKDTLPQPTRP